MLFLFVLSQFSRRNENCELQTYEESSIIVLKCHNYLNHHCHYSTFMIAVFTFLLRENERKLKTNPLMANSNFVCFTNFIWPLLGEKRTIIIRGKLPNHSCPFFFGLISIEICYFFNSLSSERPNQFINIACYSFE